MTWEILESQKCWLKINWASPSALEIQQKFLIFSKSEFLKKIPIKKKYIPIFFPILWNAHQLSMRSSFFQMHFTFNYLRCGTWLLIISDAALWILNLWLLNYMLIYQKLLGVSFHHLNNTLIVSKITLRNDLETFTTLLVNIIVSSSSNYLESLRNKREKNTKCGVEKILDAMWNWTYFDILENWAMFRRIFQKFLRYWTSFLWLRNF